MDPTLLAILLLLVFATGVALLQRYRRDRCLRNFEDFHVTLAEDAGDLAWGRLDVQASGLEVEYAAPVSASKGHYERSFIFYKEQYEALGALYRYPEGLSQEQQFRRAEVIRATARPGPWRRLRRRLRNWSGMVRDALVQAVGVVVGAAQAQHPGGGIAAQQSGEGVKALSKEMVGHAGAAYDPLLERHLFRQVVLEITSKSGPVRSYCGWLKDYTSDFIEVVDAFAAPAGAARPVESFAVPETQSEATDATSENGTDEKTEDDAPAALRVEDGKLIVTNEDAPLLYVEEARAGGWRRVLGCVLPPGTTADLTLPHGVERDELRVRIGRPERVDLVVPRRRAVVRHGADGSEHHRQAVTDSIMAEAAEETRAQRPFADHPLAGHPLADVEPGAFETSDARLPRPAPPAEDEYAPRSTANSGDGSAEGRS